MKKSTLPDSKKMNLGKKIMLIRILRDMTQSDLAEKIHKTRAMISHIEKNGKVNHHTLKLICDALHITETELESFDGNLVFGSEIKELKEKVSRYEQEIELLKEVVGTQKELLQMLKRKKR